MCKARHVKIGVHIDTDKKYEMCDGHVPSKFLEISQKQYKISNNGRQKEIICGLSNGTNISDPGGHFICLKLSNSHISRYIACIKY